MKQQSVVVIGGSGFIGQYTCIELAKAGYRVSVASRHPEKAAPIKTAGQVGQVCLCPIDINDEDSIKRSIQNADIVVNLVGILYETHRQKFSSVHAQAAERIAKIATDCGVKRLIHMSALGVNRATQSKYALSKMNGEKAVKAAFPDVTIVRPSVVYGKEDDFTNLFACLTKFSPVLPLIGGGKTKFQPVYVVDVAKAIVAIIADTSTKGKTYELGGPKVYSFKEIIQKIVSIMGKKRALVPLPFTLASIKAAFMELSPKPMLTRDQVKLLQRDNVVSGDTPTFNDLHIIPQNMEAVLPTYLKS